MEVRVVTIMQKFMHVRTSRYYYGGPWLTGPMVYIKTYIFNHCYEQCLVLLTMAPRNTTVCCYIVTTEGTSTHFFYIRSHRTVSARTFCPDPSLFVPQTDRSKQQIDTNIR